MRVEKEVGRIAADVPALPPYACLSSRNVSVLVNPTSQNVKKVININESAQKMIAKNMLKVRLCQEKIMPYCMA